MFIPSSCVCYVRLLVRYFFFREQKFAFDLFCSLIKIDRLVFFGERGQILQVFHSLRHEMLRIDALLYCQQSKRTKLKLAASVPRNAVTRKQIWFNFYCCTARGLQYYCRFLVGNAKIAYKILIVTNKNVSQ